MKTIGNLFSSLSIIGMFSAVIVSACLIIIFGTQDQKIGQF